MGKKIPNLSFTIFTSSSVKITTRASRMDERNRDRSPARKTVLSLAKLDAFRPATARSSSDPSPLGISRMMAGDLSAGHFTRK